MELLNTSKDFHADDEGNVLAGKFCLKAGEKAHLTLTAPNKQYGHLEFSVFRVAGEIEKCNCPAHGGKKISSSKREAILAHHDGGDSRATIEWPGRYFIHSNLNSAMCDPCYPVVVELHTSQCCDDTTETHKL